MAKKETDLQRSYKDLAKKLKRKIKDINKRGYVLTIEEPKRITKRVVEKLQNIVENIYDYAKYYDPLTDSYISGNVRRKQERQIAARKAVETRRMNQALDYWEKNRKDDTESFHDMVMRRRQEKGQSDYDNQDFDDMPYEALEILRKVERMIEEWQPYPNWSPWLANLKRQDRNALKSIFDGAIRELGWVQCAKNIKDQASWFFALCEHILYESESRRGGSFRDGIQREIVEVATIIRGRPLTVAESIDITELEDELNAYEE